MSRKNRYKIKILKSEKSDSYKHLIGKEFYLTVSQVKVHSDKYRIKTLLENAYLIHKSDVWLIDTQRPELSESIYSPEHLGEHRDYMDNLFQEIKTMGFFKEIWYLKSSHWASEGLWIEFCDEQKVMKDFTGYVIEHYIVE